MDRLIALSHIRTLVNDYQSEGLTYTPYIYVGENRINSNMLKSIKISEPSFNTEDKYFHYGNFISKSVEIELTKPINIDFSEKVKVYCDISETPPSDGIIPLTPYSFQRVNHGTVSTIGQTPKVNPSILYKTDFSFNDEYVTLFYQLGSINPKFTQEYYNVFIQDLSSNLDYEFVDCGVFPNNWNIDESDTYSIQLYKRPLSVIESEEDTLSQSQNSDRIWVTFRRINGQTGAISDNEKETVASLVTVQMAMGLYEEFPLGEYNIENSPIDYYGNAKLVCLDDATKLRETINIHQFFIHELDNDGNEIEYITTVGLLQALCNYFNIPLNNYPNVNTTVRTSSYAENVSAKQYMCWIAEIMGGNVVLNSNGITITENSNVLTSPFDIRKAKSFKLLDTQYYENNTVVTRPYEISHVRYDNGLIKLQSPNTDDYKNILNISADNPFINGTSADIQTTLDNIANEVVGTTINRVELVTVANLFRSKYNIVKLTDGTKNYNTFYSNETTFSGGRPMVKVSVNIPSDFVESTSVNTIPSDHQEIKKLETIINQITNTITLLATKTQNLDNALSEQYEEIAGQLTNANSAITNLQTLTTTMTRDINDTYTKDEINAIISGTDQNNNVVTVVRTVSSTFDINGLTIDGNNVSVKSNLSPRGLSILDKNDNDAELLYVGYNSDIGETQVRTKNLKVDKYFEMGTYSRYQDYTDDNGSTGTGCFWMGG